ncbi:MAG: hypothetical protein WC325_11590 [Candidatus Bathyarchaeia archaeon]|jgi:hypothetical protein
MAKKIVHKGFLTALYIEGQFIEYFDTLDSAKSFVEESNSGYKGTNFFTKPIHFFTMQEETK